MKQKTPITIEWLEAHGFEKLTGMMPVGFGERYCYVCKLSVGESIFIDISTTPDSYGHYSIHMSVKSKNENCSYYKDNVELSKRTINYEEENRNCFYVEELLTLLDLTNNSELKEFFQ